MNRSLQTSSRQLRDLIFSDPEYEHAHLAYECATTSRAELHDPSRSPSRVSTASSSQASSRRRCGATTLALRSKAPGPPPPTDVALANGAKVPLYSFEQCEQVDMRALRRRARTLRDALQSAKGAAKDVGANDSQDAHSTADGAANLLPPSPLSGPLPADRRALIGFILDAQLVLARTVGGLDPERQWSATHTFGAPETLLVDPCWSVEPGYYWASSEQTAALRPRDLSWIDDRSSRSTPSTTRATTPSSPAGGRAGTSAGGEQAPLMAVDGAVLDGGSVARSEVTPQGAADLI